MLLGKSAAKRYVYFWADGVYFNPRLDHERQCILVIIAADANGRKDIIGLMDGYRESEQSWKELLLDLKRRGLEHGPDLAAGDGALGFWKALRQVYGQAREQRCWVHKTANVLNNMPKSLQVKAKGLICEHSQVFSRGKIGFGDFTDEERERFAPVRQVLVRIHPGTGRKSLYLSSHAGGIVGWPVPEARIFLQDLTEHATQRQFVYAHEWRVGDLVIWDNRQTMHRARPFPAEEPRDMRRTTLAGDGPTVRRQH